VTFSVENLLTIVRGIGAAAHTGSKLAEEHTEADFGTDDTDDEYHLCSPTGR
jgi:hypothetical protein